MSAKLVAAVRAREQARKPKPILPPEPQPKARRPKAIEIEEPVAEPDAIADVDLAELPELDEDG